MTIASSATISTLLRAENRRLRALVDFGRDIDAERDLRAPAAPAVRGAASDTGCLAAAVILLDPEHGHGRLDRDQSGLALTWTPTGSKPSAQRRAASELSDVVPARPASRGRHAAGGRRGAALARRWSYDAPAASTNARRTAPTSAQIADAAAMAILNARLYAQSHRELRRRDALRNVVASISSELDLDSLARSRRRRARSSCSTPTAASISLIDRDGAARIRAVHNLPQRVVGAVLGPGDGITGQVLATRDAVIVEHYRRDCRTRCAEAPTSSRGWPCRCGGRAS